MDDLSAVNRERWNGLVRAGILYSRLRLDLDEETAREMVDGSGLLGDVKGRHVLLLAGGGGQQSAAFGQLGADVTVLDLSDEQLEQDRRAAEHYGLATELHQGDMRELSRFVQDAFDIVYQPYSINFVPDVEPVFAEVARVVKPGGLYHVQWHNPYTQTFDPDDYDPVRGYSSNSIYADGEIDSEAIYGTANWSVEREDGTTSEVPGPREFRHTMRTFINTLIAHGFEILAFEEHRTLEQDPEPGSWEHYKAVSPPYLAFWTRRRK
ncbi:MAG: class I SAM-dependent methyltransferase [Caldilineaceae bacterium]|nr:class I SAM-dependent methyltransferase [Caldilineaceae bacterium]